MTHQEHGQPTKRRRQGEHSLQVEATYVPTADADRRIASAIDLILRSAAQQQALADPPTATSIKEGDPDADSSADG